MRAGQPKKLSKTRAATVSVASNSALIALKLAAGIATGSVSIFAEAIHSLLDLAAAGIAFFSVRLSDRPADAQHPFGHGKIEAVSGFVEAILIVGASAAIFWQAANRIRTGAGIEFAEAGIAVMVASMVVNIFVSRWLYHAARATDSLALEADAGHLWADVFSSLAVVIALIVVRLTGVKILDPLVAIGVGVYILKIAYDLLRKSFGMLIDESLPPADQAEIKRCIEEHTRLLVGYHELRTRKLGSQHQIDLHLVMPRDATVAETHELCDHLESDLRSRIPRAEITIHVEPCPDECATCAAACSLPGRGHATTA